MLSLVKDGLEDATACLLSLNNPEDNVQVIDVNIQDELTGRAAIHYAALQGDLSITSLLVQVSEKYFYISIEFVMIYIR